jgi:hypothetical protein
MAANCKTQWMKLRDEKQFETLSTKFVPRSWASYQWSLECLWVCFLYKGQISLNWPRLIYSPTSNFPYIRTDEWIPVSTAWRVVRLRMKE